MKGTLSHSAVSEKEREKKMHYVLVHGAGHGAWCWYKVSDLLQKAGHTVTAIDLGASGINLQKIEDVVTLQDYSQPLFEFMASLPEDDKVVLVGHSLGGVNISMAMEMFPSKILVAIYVCAYLPSNGLTVTHLLEQSFELLGSFDDCEVVLSEQQHPTQSMIERIQTYTIGKEFSRKRFYANCPSQDIVLAQRMMRSTRNFKGEVVISKERFGSVPKAYVICGQDTVIFPSLQRKMIEKEPHIKVVEIEESDHSPFFCCPNHLALILQQFP